MTMQVAHRFVCRSCGATAEGDDGPPNFCTSCGEPWHAGGGARGEVVVTGIDIPFNELVTLMVKAGIAAIPATVILTVIGFLVAVALIALAGGLGVLLQ